VYSLNFCGRRL